MDSLDKKGLIVKETRRNRLSNSLVIVVARGEQTGRRLARDLTQAAVKRIALADPNSVPAGIYFRETPGESWPVDGALSKVVPTDNVRAALAAVESGNVEAGVVYKTDVAISKKVKSRLRRAARRGAGHCLSDGGGQGFRRTRTPRGNFSIISVRSNTE